MRVDDDEEYVKEAEDMLAIRQLISKDYSNNNSIDLSAKNFNILGEQKSLGPRSGDNTPISRAQLSVTNRVKRNKMGSMIERKDIDTSIAGQPLDGKQMTQIFANDSKEDNNVLY